MSVWGTCVGQDELTQQVLSISWQSAECRVAQQMGLIEDSTREVSWRQLQHLEIIQFVGGLKNLLGEGKRQ